MVFLRNERREEIETQSQSSADSKANRRFNQAPRKIYYAEERSLAATSTDACQMVGAQNRTKCNLALKLSAGKADNQLVLLLADDFIDACVKLPHFPTLVGQRSFVVEVVQSVVRQGRGMDREVNGRDSVKFPSSQPAVDLDHQVPMATRLIARRPCVFQNYESWHAFCATSCRPEL